MKELIHSSIPSESNRIAQRTQVVSVRGVSDARVSQGLVAVVASGLTGAAPQAVLALEPDELATVRV